MRAPKFFGGTQLFCCQKKQRGRGARDRERGERARETKRERRRERATEREREGDRKKLKSERHIIKHLLPGPWLRRRSRRCHGQRLPTSQLPSRPMPKDAELTTRMQRFFFCRACCLLRLAASFGVKGFPLARPGIGELRGWRCHAVPGMRIDRMLAAKTPAAAKDSRPAQR